MFTINDITRHSAPILLLGALMASGLTGCTGLKGLMISGERVILALGESEIPSVKQMREKKEKGETVQE